jgi:hypothetical protein
MRCTPSNALSADLVQHLAREVDSCVRVFVQGMDEVLGNVNPGVSAESLRAIVAELGTKTPANTGPSKATSDRHSRRAGTDQLT